MIKEEITKALKNIKIRCHPKVVWDDTIDYDLDTIEKSLKALEIIKEKKVDIKLLKASSTVEQYNNELIRVLGRWFAEREFLTIEEFELLRSVLE